MVALSNSCWRELSLLWWRAGGELEKAVAGWRRGGGEEDGQRGGAMEREEGGWPRSGTVEMVAVGAPTTMENVEAARQSTVAVERVRSSCGDFFLKNGDNRLRLGASGRKATTIGPLG